MIKVDQYTGQQVGDLTRVALGDNVSDVPAVAPPPAPTAQEKPYEAALLPKDASPEIIQQMASYINDKYGPRASSEYMIDYLKTTVTDPGIAAQLGVSINAVHGPAAATSYMNNFYSNQPKEPKQQQPLTEFTVGPRPQTSADVGPKEQQDNPIVNGRADTVSYGGYQPDPINHLITPGISPLTQKLAKAKEVTAPLYPNVPPNLIEQKAALEDTINQGQLSLQDAVRNNDAEQAGAIQNYLSHAENVYKDLGSVGNNNAQLYGDSLTGNTARRGLQTPVLPGDSKRRDLSKVEMNIIARDPKLSAGGYNGFRTFKTLLENDNRYDFNKEQIAYILATVHHNTKGTFDANSESALPDGGDSNASRMASNIRAAGYQGRGYLDTQGIQHYENMSQILGVDLVNNPEMAKQPQVAYNILIESLMNGLVTGKKLTDYINPSKRDFYNARNTSHVDFEGAEDIMVLANRYLEQL